MSSQIIITQNFFGLSAKCKRKCKKKCSHFQKHLFAKAANIANAAHAANTAHTSNATEDVI